MPGSSDRTAGWRVRRTAVWGTGLLRRLGTSLLPKLVLFVLLLVSLYLLSIATQNTADFGRLYSWLLLINVTALVVLVGLIGANVYRLVRQHRLHAPGARLTLRLVIVFVLLAVAPVSVVYYFSLQFLHSGIDSWFDVRIEQALEDALDLGRGSLDVRMRDAMRQTQGMSAELMDVPDVLAALTLNDLRSRSGAAELTLMGMNGRIIASSSIEPAAFVPNRPTEPILLQLRQGRSYVGLDPIGDSGLHIRVVVHVVPAGHAPEVRILQALFPVAERLSVLADSVQQAYAEYKELAYLREPLKYSFTLTLSLVLLLSLLSAVWAAFFTARRVVAPVRELAEGTQAVAAGDYAKRLPLSGHDELGFLVQSFNDMTRKIALARDEARRSQEQAESQRAYLEAVLGSLSSGVLVLDTHGILRTANAAAGLILGDDLAPHIGRPLAESSAFDGPLGQFHAELAPHLTQDGPSWRQEVTLFTGGRQVLMCRGTHLPDSGGRSAGQVIVFNDITALIQAQRDAAWGEVARRLAHEIKNPLTPIQLSAERLRRKYLKTMSPKDAEVLDRSTHTIVQQVEAMKEMVNAFAEYARAPKVQLAPLELNALINEVLDLYRGGDSKLKLELSLEPDLPLIEADAGRLRQLLHNVVKNAQEAMADRDEARLAVATQRIVEPGRCLVELRLRDNGPGFRAEVLGQLFEPYVTTKHRGTGLGLAIVKKIVEEHGGVLWGENVEDGGACVVIRLPAAEAAGEGAMAERAARG
jgi:nitrogen fixation/metabolism regulation signal transduction histidine kinase